MRRVFYGWWIVLACFILNFYKGGVVFYGFTAYFEPLVKEFGWSYAQISLAMSLRGLEMSIFAPFLGFLVDRLGARKLVFCGVIMAGFGFFLLSATRSLPMFYGSFLLLAFGLAGCGGVVFMTATARWFDRNVGKALGIVACGVGIGGFLVPLIVWLINLYHWKTSLVILGLGMWVLGIPLSFVIRDKPEQYGYLPDGESRRHSLSPLKNREKEVKIAFKEVLKQKAFLHLAIMEVIRQMTAFAVIIHIMPYLSSKGIPRSTAGMVAGAIPLFSIAGRIGFGWLGDIFNKRTIMAVALCLTAAGLLAFAHVERRAFILVFLLLFPTGCWGSMILTRTIQREFFGRDYFGRVLGIMMGCASVGGIIGPTLAGWVFDTLRSYQIIWLLFCGFCGLSIWLILTIKPLAKTGT